MIKKQFPTSYDVEQTIKYKNTSYNTLKQFMQSTGIINVGNSKEQIAQFASNVLFEHQDYIFMRRLAQGAYAATNISGFVIRPITIPIGINELKDDLCAFRRQLNQQAKDSTKRGAPTQKLAMPQIENGIIKTRFEYQRLIPGRVELLERVDTKVDFTVEPIPKTSQWRVICYPQANQDVKKLERLFKKMGGKGAYEPFTISLEDFPQQKRILFFDTILEHYRSHDEWQFQEVTEITMRQPSSSNKNFIVDEEDIEPDDEELMQELSQDDLLSITQAILHGRHLRTNSFVKKCERQGFYFPSMTLLLWNRKTPEVIQVKIRFKLSPRMFEVILAEMRERVDIADVPVVFSASRQQEILKEFWDTSHKIWQQIYNEVPKPPEQQLSLADIMNQTR